MPTPPIVDAALPHGTCPIHLFGDATGGGPTAILFMDAFGPRPALFDIAAAIAAEGWRVLLPDLFYAHAPYRPLSPASLFAGGEDRQRLHAMVAGLDQDRLDADVGALLDVAAGRSGAPLAAIGYCLGGRYALTAATLRADVRFAAAIHGSGLAPREGASAHRRFADVAGAVYVGVADPDPTFDAAEEGRLAEALRAGRVAHVIESYRAGHGFAMADLPVYDEAAAAHHLRRLREGLADALR